MISRRQFLSFSALFSFFYPIVHVNRFAMAGERKGDVFPLYPLTIDMLKQAYWSEMIASRHYDAYSQKALVETYPNIAYLFYVLSNSEKIHAENYKKLMGSLGVDFESRDIPISISGTKKNLHTAAKKELEKINQFYPRIFDKLLSESHDRAILYCMYSWKSHKQHEIMIRDIKRYSGLFFGSLANKIENMNPDYYVCNVCGSTLDGKPSFPCDICNYSIVHYEHIQRPAIQKM